MVEKISAEQSYMNYMLSKMPTLERGEEYKVKKGDNIWDIAKNKLASPTARKSEIQEYMYQIAKLNNINTIEEMNSLRISDVIYLPKCDAKKKASVQGSGNVSKVSTSQKTNKTSQAVNVKPSSTPVKVQKNPAETSILNLTEQIKNDKTITIEKMHKFGISSNDLYHVYCEKKEPGLLFYSRKHPLMSFTIDRVTGKVITVSYNEQPVARNASMYDYDLCADGRIETHNHIKQTNQGKLSTNELNNLHSKLKALVSENFK